ncbi:hypothetical protein V7S43_017706 [Phytophthora oleae]|uniref:IBB domain-containing protein n=1 Tax=Phytophthora oleae TaxID=2107226 RepID=A0ABD3ESV4_9STRA
MAEIARARRQQVRTGVKKDLVEKDEVRFRKERAASTASDGEDSHFVVLGPVMLVAKSELYTAPGREATS